jgi:hypothetical protein
MVEKTGVNPGQLSIRWYSLDTTTKTRSHLAHLAHPALTATPLSSNPATEDTTEGIAVDTDRSVVDTDKTVVDKDRTVADMDKSAADMDRTAVDTAMIAEDNLTVAAMMIVSLLLAVLRTS